MFERFSAGARRAVVEGQAEARRLSHGYIGTEHLLLGLLRENSELIAVTVLESLGVSPDNIRAAVETAIGEGPGSPSGHIPFTAGAKRVLELSLREALQLGHTYIGPEHILLGLIREGQGTAAMVLFTLGVTLEAVRPGVVKAVDEQRQAQAKAVKPTEEAFPLSILEVLGVPLLAEMVGGLVDGVDAVALQLAEKDRAIAERDKMITSLFSENESLRRAVRQAVANAQKLIDQIRELVGDTGNPKLSDRPSPLYQFKGGLDQG
jgi:ATP-dependent Clp protease ATP-binding subunit ClpC